MPRPVDLARRGMDHSGEKRGGFPPARGGRAGLCHASAGVTGREEMSA